MKGSVYKRGKNWSYIVDIPRDDMNQRRQKKKGGFRTKKEAEAALAQLIAEIEQGTYLEPSKMTVKDLLEQWLEYKATTVRKSTWLDYEITVRLHLLPVLGKIPLQKLTALHVQNLYTKNPIPTSQTRKAHIALNDALRRAVKWGLLSKNVCEAVDKPAQPKKQFKVWTFEETARFLDHAKQLGTECYLPALLAVTTGMRMGEIVGLTWDDIDFEKGVLSVRRTFARVKREYVIHEPKTSSGQRLISLPTQTLEILRKHKVKQLEERLKAGATYIQSDYVLTGKNGKHMVNHSVIWFWQKALKDAGVPIIRFHDLRHTHASLLLQQGVHPKIVSERLGHSDISMTLNIYSHVIPGIQETAATKFGDALFGEK